MKVTLKAVFIITNKVVLQTKSERPKTVMDGIKDLASEEVGYEDAGYRKW